MILVVAACSLLAILLSMRFLRVISVPLTNLIATATNVSVTQDYSLRAKKLNDDDEMGRFTDRFNQMLEQIQSRDVELHTAHGELEARMKKSKDEHAELDKARELERELRDKLSRSERMESLGQLAGGVAHDLNNILGPVVAYPEMILERLRSDDPLANDIRQIRDSANRASAVIQDLLTLGRRGNYKLGHVDLNKLIRNYLKSPDFTRMSDSLKNVRIVTHLHEELAPIHASSHHLEKVLMNFTINAFEAMSNGGELKIETYYRRVGNLVSGYEEIPAGDYVVMSVSDTGTGIARKNVARIFEPFFTQKQMGRSGSGLGLAVVYGVVKDLGGYIDVMSAVGRGTQFTVFLAPDPSSLPDIQEQEPPRGGDERILVVDDIEEQRDLAMRILDGFGYQATAVDSGQSAMEYLDVNTVDLVVLDMILGDGMDGLETFREYIKLVPDGRCVLVSGYTETDRIKETMQLGAGAFVHKPYSRDDLARAVRETLDR
jgi:signal transduction histidine kinase